MKASANLLTKWSIAGLTFVFMIDVVGIARATAQQNTGATPSGGSFVAPPPDSGANPAATELPKPQSGHDALMKSRQALANGDIALAKSLIDSARHLPSDSHLTGDTPAKVEAMIARHGELANMARFGDQHRYNNEAALFLLEQAEALIDYRDFGTAESLVLLAKQFPVTFKPGDRNPDQVMDRLQQARGTGSVDPQNVSAAKIEAFKLLSQAQLAYDQNNMELAQQLVTRAKNMNLADSAFDGESIKPWELELKIRKAINSNIAQATYESPENETVKQADYYPELDRTQNQLASNEVPATVSTDVDATQNPVDESRFQLPDMRGQQLYESGMSALANNDKQLALEYFRMAWKYKSQLDVQAQQVLQEKLGQLQATPASYRQQEEVQGVNEDLRQKMFTDVLRQRAVAEEMVKQRNPRGAMNHLRMLKDQVSQSALDPAGKQQLTAVVEREISELEDFIQRNISEIENDEMNAFRRQEVEMDRQRRDDVERQIQKLVDEFNKLVYEERWAEAEVIARQAEAIAPELEVVAVMVQKAKFRARIERDRDVQERKESRFVEHMIDLDEDTIPNDYDQPIEFDQNTWDRISQSQKRSIDTGFETIREREIWAKIRNESIQADFSNTPLSEAIDTLALKAGVNMIFDSRAMQMENVAIDQPVTMSIPNAISVESALNIILGNNNLVFTVEDEVIKITNQDALQKDPKRRVYYVGDLIMPVPDYGDPVIMKSMSPWSNGSQQYQGNRGWNGNGTNLGGDPSMEGVSPISMMKQQMPNMPGNPFNGFGGGFEGSGTTRTSAPDYNSLGPDGVGGGITEADFQELMDLIQETIDPDSWEDAGGSGRMQAFPATLSLIVTQTQENQDRIQDLLQRLRELNDVQIVVEVRFITLRDDFFERIGVDFDFRINDFTDFNPATVAIQDEFNPSGIIGRDAIAEVFLPTGDLDIPFTQNSFGSAIPQFGNFDAATAFNTGFAILSDIEVFFLLQAAKGDERSNIVQAPTVTMFNGQSASVFDGSLRPFVTSITPVVGDFAAAQQPVITILPEGTQLNVRATVSGDRRFVKMTLVPFFSQITAVDEFRFEGSRTVRSSDSNNLNDIIDAIQGRDNDLGDNDFEITEEGTTVQLPVFANTTITTTVSVPDGGTVLLGGIKRMSEGRIERGVPFLSNVPYVSRLFKNVGIGRETSSLMMMVTPRIIIQEEEEQFQVGTAPGN